MAGEPYGWNNPKRELPFLSDEEYRERVMHVALELGHGRMTRPQADAALAELQLQHSRPVGWVPPAECGVPLRLERGEVKAVWGKMWGRCADCGKVIRWDKPIFGSLHYCD